jgi:pilus assembly protein Flp/PilA
MLQVYTQLMAFITARRDEHGVTAIEYGLIASLIAVAIIGALILVGGGLEETFDNIAGNL